MSNFQTTPAISFSKAALAGTSEQLFPDAPSGSFNLRMIVNPNAANTIWVNPLGGPAVVNGLDCIPVLANGSLTLTNTNQVNVIGTAGDKVTAFQR